MAQKLLQHVRGAIAHLKPDAVRALAERPLSIVVRTPHVEQAEALRTLWLDSLVGARRDEAARALLHESEAVAGQRFQIILYDRALSVPQGWDDNQDAFAFDALALDAVLPRILDAREDLWFALARRFPVARDRVSRSIVHRTAKENAMFALMSALPDIVPSLAEFPWAIGEFASDTAVLTANQIRMAFQLAAAHDNEVGFSEQRNEIGALIAGAFGWRALAREAVGKIPFGGGLIPKAAIAYAGTWVTGVSMERVYRFGYGMTRAERTAVWNEALQHGKDVAAQLLTRVRRPTKKTVQTGEEEPA